jgi:hypothetical protein
MASGEPIRQPGDRLTGQPEEVSMAPSLLARRVKGTRDRLPPSEGFQNRRASTSRRLPGKN